MYTCMYVCVYTCTYVHANMPSSCHSQSQAKLKAVESQINAIVASVFSERYRDVVEDVRGKCIEELGVWIMEYKYVHIYVSYVEFEFSGEVHTYICTYSHTYVVTYVRTYIQTYVRMYVYKY